MISVAQVVEDIIKESPFLEEGLRLGIINLSSLARMIKPKVEKETKKTVKAGSIIMALKRTSLKNIPKFFNLKEGFEKEADITIRSNLFEITFPMTKNSLKKQGFLLQKISHQKGLFLTITQGLYEITIIASQKIKKEVEKVFNEEKPLAYLDNLSAITIHFSKKAVDTPGLFYFLLKTLAWENISVIEIVSTFTEFTFILKNENVGKAFSLLQEILKKID